MNQCAYYRSSVAASTVGEWPNLNIQMLTERTSTPIQRVGEERS